MTFYTNSKPRASSWWIPHGGYRPRYGLRTPRITVPHFADVRLVPARWLRARGIPAVVGPTPARDERFGRSKRCSNAESTPPGSFAGTQVLRPPLAVKRASLPMIFERNSERMRYARYRAEKLFVGSGVVEAGCKTVIGRRLKMSGMFWTVRGANFPHCPPLQPHQRQIHRLLGVPCRMSSTIMSRTHKGVTHPHA